ncbi:hypothetical protein MYXO_00124 [Myxococcaceae bacterium]|jgi:ubiquinone biosynthesis protein UbiJ|nr:hypothetical protein MYXO_00124 [Myxococcaceae bacterium]
MDRREAAAAWLEKHFDASSARGVQSIVELDLAGAGGGPLTLHVDDGTLELSPAAAPNATARVRIDAGDFLDVLSGRANGELLHMQGRVRIEGDSSHVLRLQSLFRRRA